MLVQWHIVINGKSEGPFSEEDLTDLHSFSPESFVWKEGMNGWEKAKDIPELAQALHHKKQKPKSHDPEEPINPELEPDPEIALSLEDKDPPNFLWIFFILILVSYFLFRSFF